MTWFYKKNFIMSYFFNIFSFWFVKCSCKCMIASREQSIISYQPNILVRCIYLSWRTVDEYDMLPYECQLGIQAGTKYDSVPFCVSCAQLNSISLFFSHHFCMFIKYIMYTLIIYVTCCHFHIYVYNIIV
jgi:hypothetical protein